MGLSSCTRSERKINIRIIKKLDSMKVGSSFLWFPASVYGLLLHRDTDLQQQPSI